MALHLAHTIIYLAIDPRRAASEPISDPKLCPLRYGWASNSFLVWMAIGTKNRTTRMSLDALIRVKVDLIFTHKEIVNCWVILRRFSLFWTFYEAHMFQSIYRWLNSNYGPCCVWSDQCPPPWRTAFLEQGTVHQMSAKFSNCLCHIRQGWKEWKFLVHI